MATNTIGRYEVKEKLGKGGMAHVFLAEDPYMKRQVAIKVMSGQLLQDPEFKSRFEVEAQVIAALEHQFIVPVYDFGYHNNQYPYLVMRYLMGGSLKERIEDYGGMSLTDAAPIIERAAAALDEAHRRNVIHRDVKPDNFLLDQNGNIYLADFGIVKIMTGGASGSTGMWIAGTPAYMAPEQVDGSYPIGPATDVYALGITLFEMLTGKQPYQDQMPTRLMMKHVLEPVPDIRAHLSDVPPGIEEVLYKALSKKAPERYQSATEFAEAVNSAARTILSRRARRHITSTDLSDVLNALDE